MKKVWKKPELVVLARGKLEENVLSVCKTHQDMHPYGACTAVNNRPSGISNS